MLTDKIKKAINAHANECYPKECCGVIVNGDYIPCTNVAVDDAQFEIDVRDIVGAEKEGNELCKGEEAQNPAEAGGKELGKHAAEVAEGMGKERHHGLVNAEEHAQNSAADARKNGTAAHQDTLDEPQQPAARRHVEKEIFEMQWSSTFPMECRQAVWLFSVYHTRATGKTIRRIFFARGPVVPKDIPLWGGSYTGLGKHTA